MLSAAILGAAILTAPPPGPGFGMRTRAEVTAARDADPVPQIFRLVDWMYPEDISMGAAGKAPRHVAPNIGERGCKHYSRFARTADPFDQVSDHYRKLVGLNPGGGNSSSGDADAVANSWPDRPVKLTIITRRYGLITMQAMISRADGEAFTYITLIYRQMSD
jgi:hypothetical protein